MLCCFFSRLTLQYIPPSNVYGFDSVDLKPNGGDEVGYCYSKNL